MPRKNFKLEVFRQGITGDVPAVAEYGVTDMPYPIQYEYGHDAKRGAGAGGPDGHAPAPPLRHRAAPVHQ